MIVVILLLERLNDELLQSNLQRLFVANLAAGLLFDAVSVDYALETTENEELKCDGGIVGLTR